MKISVIMVDGGFRENVYAAKYFAQQDFEGEYEVIWVDYFDKPHAELEQIKKLKVITLNRSGMYHSSYCFNEGIKAATGDVLVIPDADQIVDRDFLTKVSEIHEKYPDLVCYGYRYDEEDEGALENHTIEELEKKCVLKNPANYGGCLTVRRNIVLDINGYEMIEEFSSGFHANGLDIYVRLKNAGYPIMWSPMLKLYHPWHDFTLADAKEYEKQKLLIDWRASNLQFMALRGIDKNKDVYDEYRDEIICLLVDGINPLKKRLIEFLIEINMYETAKRIKRMIFRHR